MNKERLKVGLTDGVNLFVKVSIFDEWQDRALKWGNQRWEVKIGSLRVTFTSFKAVLKDTVEDTANSEGGLDNIWNVLFLMVRLGLCVKSKHLLSKVEFLSFKCQLEALGFLELCLQLLQFLL